MDALELRTLLRLARLARGWRQLDVARAIGTTNVRVSRLELGYATPSPEELLKLAAVLELDVVREVAT